MAAVSANLCLAAKRCLEYLAVFCLISMTAEADQRPNILLIVADNQSPTLLGAYGNREISTPNLDALAAKGAVYTNAYAASGVCSPSRATLLTGLMPSQHGIHNALPTDPERIGIPDWSPLNEFATLPELLAEAGYETALIGKYHLGSHTTPQLGFKHWVTMDTGHTRSFKHTTVIDNGEVRTVDTHITDFWTDSALQFFGESPADKPFFLMLSFNAPYMLPPVVTSAPQSPYASMYRDSVPSFPQQAVHAFLRNWAIESRPSDHMQANSTHAWAAIGALNNPQAMLNVAAETSHLDAAIGRIVEALRNSGQLSNTLIVYTADQGSAYGQHGLWGNTSWAYPFPAYEEHLKVPLILYQPGGIREGREHEQPVAQADLFPTILQAAGVKHVDARLSGQVLATIRDASESELPKKELPGNESARAVFFEFMTVRGIRLGDHKLVMRFPDGPNELYDLSVDPEELNNVSGNADYRELERSLINRLSRYFEVYAVEKYDLWQGGTGKGRLMGDYGKNSVFSERFPGWRKPFIETLEKP